MPLKSPQRPRQRASRSRKSRPRWLGDMPDEPAAEEVAEQAPEEVATPNTLEGAESWLEENLGPEVAAVFKTIAAGYAERAVAGVSGRVDEAISRIEDADMRGHFSAIKIKHPDFMDLSGSAEMGEWISAAEDAEDLKRIMDSGTADEVISMLDRYKAAQAEMDNPTLTQTAPRASARQTPACDCPSARVR